MGLEYYHLKRSKKTVLVMGGSLGARTLNQAMKNHFETIETLTDVQFLWQCGKVYHQELASLSLPENVVLRPFLDRMDLAYAAADFMVSRAGATSISELAIVGKPCVLVPSPNVSEDHQTKNAEALSTKNAAILIKDADAATELITVLKNTLEDEDHLALLASEIRKLSLPNATKEIVQICLNQLKK
jgi:UDP-N-acetylglucosamine--N-acetylmuramyl-(pentapeptide) pyrophosphoryl-undecaprenol N-acetylglucosamine transferase